MKIIDINLSDNRWENKNIDFENIAKFVFSFMKYKGKNKSVSLLLTNDKDIKKLNKEFREINKPTNVLSFDINEDGILGDIALSYETIKNESVEQQKTFEEHATHLLVHGILHLLGYDHQNDVEADEMEALEIKILEKLGFKNPYLIIDKKESKKSLFYYISLFLIGALTSTGFAPLYWTFVSFAGIALLYLLTENNHSFKSGMKSGFAFGAGYSIVMLSWLISSFFVDTASADIFGYFAPVALVGIGFCGGIIWGLPVALTSMMNDNSWRRPVYFSGFWVLILWLRYWVFTGFPWNPFDLILTPYPILLNSVSLIGNLGLTFILIGLIVSFFQMMFSWKKSSIIIFILYLAGFSVCSIYGYSKISNQIKMSDNIRPVNIRIVQSGIPQQFKWDKIKADENILKHLELSNLPSDEKIDVIIWPESSFPYTINSNEFPLAKGISVDYDKVVFGAIYKNNNLFYNSILTSDKEGNIVYNYKKHHLVPFGEYNPLKIIGLDKIVPVPGQLVPGSGSVMTQISNDFSVSFASCYEIIFSEANIPYKTNPDAIINLTNDGWFGKSFGPYQHLDIARSIAIETGTPVIRSAYSGISAVIDAYGQIHEGKKLGLGESGVIDIKVPSKIRSEFSRIGNKNIIFGIMSLVLLCFISRLFFRKN